MTVNPPTTTLVVVVLAAVVSVRGGDICRGEVSRCRRLLPHSMRVSRSSTEDRVLC